MFDNLSGVAIEVEWRDEDVLALAITASNKRLAFKTRFYADCDAPKRFASVLSGFPTDTADIREFKFGGLELTGYGGAKFQFTCHDKLGHVVLSLSIAEKSDVFYGQFESITMLMLIEPSAIDSFVRQLIGLHSDIGQLAKLEMSI